MSETTDRHPIGKAIVETFTAQADHNQAVLDALTLIADRLSTLEARIGKIARNLPKS